MAAQGLYYQTYKRNMKCDIRQELKDLQDLQGIDFIRRLKLIVARKEFRPLETDPEIFLVGGQDDDDFPRLLDAARKAVVHDYRVYILPNPHGIRTADFIFVRKGLYRMYDLKLYMARVLWTVSCLTLSDKPTAYCST